MALSLGIDTGGTCTDAVLLDADQRVVASAKALTTHGALLGGMAEASAAVLRDIQTCEVDLVSLSTTLATNAVVEGRGRRVGLVLIGFSEHWLERAQLAEALGDDPVVFVNGGHAADGSEAVPLDLESLARSARPLVDQVEAWAVSSVFAVRNPDHERRAAECLAGVAAMPVSLGYRLSAALDAPRRALTALLNARLIPSLVELLDAAELLLTQLGIDAPLMVVKGDGTLMAASMARQLPVETILSGPAASVIAARAFGAMDSGVVVDIGGTTSDIAVLEHGLPRLDPNGAQVGGWRTMVQAVDIASIGLGGDSELHIDDAGEMRAGPRRVIPLSLLAQHNPCVIPAMSGQLERGWPTSHDAAFAVALPVGSRRPRSAGQRELLARIPESGIALETLFAARTEALSLSRLEADGFIRRAGFTPSDASHVLGQQTTWDAGAAELGARLWARQIADAGGIALQRLSEGNESPSIRAVARAACHAVEVATAAAVASHVLQLVPESKRRDRERAVWLDEALRRRQSIEAIQETSTSTSNAEDLAVSFTLGMPLIGLGASASLYHPGAARLLDTYCEIPADAGVANALGAVSGVVRQIRTVRLQPAGGKSVVALLPNGPKTHADLESAATHAEQEARSMAYDAAVAAGVDADPGTLLVSCQRVDTTVEQDGNTLFVESVVTAIASGRPARHRA